MNIEEKEWLLLKNTDFQRPIWQPKVHLMVGIGRFHWNKSGKVIHFAWYGDFWYCTTFIMCHFGKLFSCLIFVFFLTLFQTYIYFKTTKIGTESHKKNPLSYAPFDKNISIYNINVNRSLLEWAIFHLYHSENKL